jgi:hypothetical protein
MHKGHAQAGKPPVELAETAVRVSIVADGKKGKK